MILAFAKIALAVGAAIVFAEIIDEIRWRLTRRALVRLVELELAQQHESSSTNHPRRGGSGDIADARPPACRRGALARSAFVPDPPNRGARSLR